MEFQDNKDFRCEAVDDNVNPGCVSGLSQEELQESKNPTASKVVESDGDSIKSKDLNNSQKEQLELKVDQKSKKKPNKRNKKQRNRFGDINLDMDLDDDVDKVIVKPKKKRNVVNFDCVNLDDDDNSLDEENELTEETNDVQEKETLIIKEEAIDGNEKVDNSVLVDKLSDSGEQSTNIPNESKHEIDARTSNKKNRRNKKKNQNRNNPNLSQKNDLANNDLNSNANKKNFDEMISDDLLAPDKSLGSESTNKNAGDDNKSVEPNGTVENENLTSSVINADVTKNKKKRNKKKKTAQPPPPEPKGGRKPNQAMLSKMKEAVERRKQEEERKRLEEEAIKKALEEAERKEREAEQKALEERERKKRERKEQLLLQKQLGMPTTKAQILKQQKLQMMLESLKSQGVDVPSLPTQHVDSNKEKPKYMVYKTKKQQNRFEARQKARLNKESSEVETNSTLPSPDDIISEKSPDEKKTIEEISTEEIQTEQTIAEDVVPDNWLDDESSQTEESITKKAVETPKSETKKKSLRSPIICVLGHVDTGKTKILDKLRLTNVQGGEAGGITQQIGVTNVHIDNISSSISNLHYMKDFKYFIPGLLFIDTPGHETFRNLRSRGSSLCDIAILVVDIMHGIEQQTLESFQLLVKRKTPFVIALNKVDRIYQWKSDPSLSITEVIKNQTTTTFNEYNDRFKMIVTQFAEQGVNVALFNECQDFENYIPIVPTSAHSGDGISDIIAFICSFAQKFQLKRLTHSETVFQATVLEVKSAPGVGIVVDIILINGTLSEGDMVVFSGIDEPIATQVRAILTAQPMTDLRASKSNYDKHQHVSKSQGIRLLASGELEKIIAGTSVLKVTPQKTLESCQTEAINNVQSVLNMVQIQDQGVYVQASTIGSLEALLDYLKDCKISVGGVNIGPVHKKDVLRASVMIEKNPMFAVILAFDVKVDSEAMIHAKKENVRIFTADIIYHLTDAFTNYTKECKEQQKEQHRSKAVFPCKLRILPECIFNKRDPIILGVSVEAGSLKIGTPLCVPTKDFLYIGNVSSVELNNKPLPKAITGQEVAIKIESVSGEAPKMYDRHFTHSDLLYSQLTRDSIDILKDYFKDEVSKNEWKLIIEMKKIFKIL